MAASKGKRRRVLASELGQAKKRPRTPDGKWPEGKPLEAPVERSWETAGPSSKNRLLDLRYMYHYLNI